MKRPGGWGGGGIAAGGGGLEDRNEEIQLRRLFFVLFFLSIGTEKWEPLLNIITVMYTFLHAFVPNSQFRN